MRTAARWATSFEALHGEETSGEEAEPSADETAAVVSEAHLEDAVPQAPAPEASNTPIIAIGAGIAFFANVLLVVALIRRSRVESDGASSKLAAAVDGYKQALDARAA
jgi:hypothetical protein